MFEAIQYFPPRRVNKSIPHTTYGCDTEKKIIRVYLNC